MNEFFPKNPYQEFVPYYPAPDLSKYRFVSTTAQGNRTYRRETPKPIPKKQIRAWEIRVQNLTLSADFKGYDYNILDKYSRRKFRRMSAAVETSARSNFLASAAQYKD
jgi:hypothetical protein